MYILLEFLQCQLVGLLSAFELIAISSSESASIHFTSFTDCEYVTCLWAAITRLRVYATICKATEKLS